MYAYIYTCITWYLNLGSDWTISTITIGSIWTEIAYRKRWRTIEWTRGMLYNLQYITIFVSQLKNNFGSIDIEYVCMWLSKLCEVVVCLFWWLYITKLAAIYVNTQVSYKVAENPQQWYIGQYGFMYNISEWLLVASGVDTQTHIDFLDKSNFKNSGMHHQQATKSKTTIAKNYYNQSQNIG